MLSEAGPLGFRELHPAPIGEARVVLRTERDAPRLAERALGVSNMRLELDRVRAGRGDRLNEGMSRPEASVVGLCDFGHYDAWGGIASQIET